MFRGLAHFALARNWLAGKWFRRRSSRTVIAALSTLREVIALSKYLAPVSSAVPGRSAVSLALLQTHADDEPYNMRPALSHRTRGNQRRLQQQRKFRTAWAGPNVAQHRIIIVAKARPLAQPAPAIVRVPGRAESPVRTTKPAPVPGAGLRSRLRRRGSRDADRSGTTIARGPPSSTGTRWSAARTPPSMSGSPPPPVRRCR